MAAGDQRDPELAGRVRRHLLGLAGDVDVIALTRGLDHAVASTAARDRHRLDRVGTARQDQGLTARLLADARYEVSEWQRPGQRPAEADLLERTLRGYTEPRCELRVVAELRVRVQRQVVRGERHV